MIRKSMIGALAVLAACAPAANDDELHEAESEEAADAAPRGAIATVAVDGGPDDCNFRWDGEVATRLDLGTRAAAEVEQAIVAHGGVNSMGEGDMPFAILEAAADQPYDCMALVVEDLRQVGVYWADLRIAGKAGDQRVHFEVPGIGPAGSLARLAIEPDGRAVWNGQEVELAELPDWALSRTSGPASPESIIVTPAAGVSLGSVYDVVEAIRSAGRSLTLAGADPDDIPALPPAVGIPPPVRQVPIPGRPSTQR